MIQTIDLTAIDDPLYRTKFVLLPDIIEEWVQPYLSLSGADVLDFGCGEATTALGLALRKGAARVVCVDINTEADRCAPLAKRHLGMEKLPGNLSLHRVEVGSLHDPSDRFHLIYNWSVFEHVREDLILKTLHMLRQALVPGGLLFTQITPLFYSSEGSHLFQKVPERWGHLCHQDSEYMHALAAACPDKAEHDSLVSTYRTLNRITASRLVGYIKEAGFDILREYLTYDDYPIPPEIEAVYQQEVLRTQQIVLLARA